METDHRAPLQTPRGKTGKNRKQDGCWVPLTEDHILSWQDGKDDSNKPQSLDFVVDGPVSFLAKQFAVFIAVHRNTFTPPIHWELFSLRYTEDEPGLAVNDLRFTRQEISVMFNLIALHENISDSPNDFEHDMFTVYRKMFRKSKARRKMSICLSDKETNMIQLWSNILEKRLVDNCPFPAASVVPFLIGYDLDQSCFLFDYKTMQDDKESTGIHLTKHYYNLFEYLFGVSQRNFEDDVIDYMSRIDDNKTLVFENDGVQDVCVLEAQLLKPICQVDTKSNMSDIIGNVQDITKDSDGATMLKVKQYSQLIRYVYQTNEDYFRETGYTFELDIINYKINPRIKELIELHSAEVHANIAATQLCKELDEETAEPSSPPKIKKKHKKKKRKQQSPPEPEAEPEELNEYECPVCLDVIQDLSDKELIKSCRNCSKMFHACCLVKWVTESKNITCPNCIQSLF